MEFKKKKINQQKKKSISEREKSAKIDYKVSSRRKKKEYMY